MNKITKLTMIKVKKFNDYFNIKSQIDKIYAINDVFSAEERGNSLLLMADYKTLMKVMMMCDEGDDDMTVFKKRPYE